MGSPCQMPLDGLKNGKGSPLSLTLKVAEVTYVITLSTQKE